MEQIRKTFKAETDVGDEGKFRAVVSTFGTVDSQGEAIEKGAFANSIDDDVPVLWDHQWDNIWSHIGSAKATETEEGLVVDATLDLDNPTAAQAYKLLKSGRVKEFSIGGFEDPNTVKTSKDGVRHVGKFDLAEVSLTLRGANPDTRLLDVKADEPEDSSGSDDSGSSDSSDEDPMAQLVDTLTSVSSALADAEKAVDGLIDEFGTSDDSSDEDNSSDEQDSPSDGEDSQASDDSGAKSMSARVAAARIALAAMVRKEH